ncbi:MAG: cysteine desulfurase family protein [Patescibacteria group bacterium]|nr:cysteine desulfurase family protein [Patescibacteria group bacterium]
MKRIYFDNAATTKIDESVMKAMIPYFNLEFGNASSIHEFGQKAEAGVLNAKYIISKFLNCKPNEIIFTSGATESNNTILQGVFSDFKGHLITTMFEHPCVLETAKYLLRRGVDVTFIAPEKNGVIDPQKIFRAIKEDTRLVSIMYANNEVGTVSNIAHIGKKIEELNQKRINKILFHTDAVQACYFRDMDVKKLRTDFVSISSHKIYGPKGIGAFFMREHTKLSPLMYGGHQEYGIRPGTYNVPAIIGFGKAIQLISSKNHKKTIEKMKKIRDFIIKESLKIKGVFLNGDREQRLENNINLLFENIEGESLLLKLDLEGIACSTGSACASGSLSASHVLLSMGIKPENAHGSLRISLGKYNTMEEAERFIITLKKSVGQLREFSPFK